ncbi:WGR domain-containing protein [Escherichia coli]|nr:WGR domain-containing protein [Escherichia coli]
MKTYIYQDEKSHKFWAVEQQGNELNISWGKVGTNGQSQVKSFADAAAAEKAELKLIAEKTKKGYVEHAENATSKHTRTVTKSLELSDFSTIIQEQPSVTPDDAPRDKCTLSCAINGIHAAFHYLKKNYISGCVMTVPTG